MVKWSCIEDFFSDMAACFERQEAEAFIEFYHLPVVIISDNRRTVYSTESDLEQYLQDWSDRLVDLGGQKQVLVSFQSMSLSEKIQFANVKWQLSAEDGAVIYECHNSYTLQKSEDLGYQIIVAVMDDEERQIEELEQYS